MSKPRVYGVGVGPLQGRGPGRHMKKLLGLLWSHAAGRPVGRPVGFVSFQGESQLGPRGCVYRSAVCPGRLVGSVGAGLVSAGGKVGARRIREHG
jgi:hypothetical protein